MPIQPQKVETIPAETVRVATAAFAKGNFCLKLREELGTLYQDEQFVKLFSTEEQLTLAPWRLALITVLQFNET